MEVNIFILCYNEEILLPHTIAHYRANIPDCHIIIYDNMSTDNSVNIAKEFGCAVIQWKSNTIDDNKYLKIKNNCWGNIKKGWIICIDMDEWLCVTYNDLLYEYVNGATVLNVKGYNMIGDSKLISLEDINLHSLEFGSDFPSESKHLCFYAPDIKTVKYGLGAHIAEFTGNICYSQKRYINKHMEMLGLPFYLYKKKERFNRLTQKKIKKNSTNYIMKYVNKHYSSDMEHHTKIFIDNAKKAESIFPIITNSDQKVFEYLLYKILNLSIEVYIFILCYNEEVLLPHTVAHYRSNIPDCHIIIYDNMSTDNSVNIAKKLGCAVVQWQSNGIDDNQYINIKNNCWRHIKNGWVMCIDMDEWLCATYNDLLEEYSNGATVLNVKGYNMIGNSKMLTLEDINLHSLRYGIDYTTESKHLCFYAPDIKSVKYDPGAHNAEFIGNICYSRKYYINKHMEMLGLPFYLNKKKLRFNRLNKKDTDNYKQLTSRTKHYCSSETHHTKAFIETVKKTKDVFPIITDIDKKMFELFMFKILNIGGIV